MINNRPPVSAAKNVGVNYAKTAKSRKEDNICIPLRESRYVSSPGFCQFPADIHLFKVNNIHTRKR